MKNLKYSYTDQYNFFFDYNQRVACPKESVPKKLYDLNIISKKHCIPFLETLQLAHKCNATIYYKVSTDNKKYVRACINASDKKLLIETILD